MFRSPDHRPHRFAFRAALAVALLAPVIVVQAQVQYPGIGRAATASELAAWDIDVRPDFKGLPPGRGSVAQGQDIWEAKCASCHGVFGESNQVFSPLVGGTTNDDVKTGRVARLNDPAFPGRTTLMKVATVSTLWDYIQRAMPWTAPKSLKPDEVYAVTAFLLNLGDIVPENFELTDKNIAQVQAMMPNRNGMTLNHGLWAGKGLAVGKVDSKAVACMSNCATEAAVGSFLPDFARGAHGNLADQNRAVGAQRGANTSSVTTAAPVTTAAAQASASPALQTQGNTASADAAALALTAKHGCSACHGLSDKIVGPGFREVAAKHGAGSASMLEKKIKGGGSGVWGAIPMPPQALPDADAKTMAEWIARGAQQ
jgi:S-disulfanyl-L-cysteine oxidoreductase SoxD